MLTSTQETRLAFLQFLIDTGEATPAQESEFDNLMQLDADGPQPWNGWCQD